MCVPKSGEADFWNPMPFPLPMLILLCYTCLQYNELSSNPNMISYTSWTIYPHNSQMTYYICITLSIFHDFIQCYHDHLIYNPVNICSLILYIFVDNAAGSTVQPNLFKKHQYNHILPLFLLISNYFGISPLYLCKGLGHLHMKGREIL